MGEDQTESAEKDQKHGFLKAWRSLFSFTAESHLLVLLPAVSCSVAAAGLQPTMAFFFGKFFDTFSDFAAGTLDGETFISKCRSSVFALLAIGAATLLLKGTLFSLWLVFGELQARRVRELLFTSLLARDIEWYEARTTGVATLLTRFQGYGIPWRKSAITWLTSQADKGLTSWGFATSWPDICLLHSSLCWPWPRVAHQLETGTRCVVSNPCHSHWCGRDRS